jgi:hypothetical protein
MCGPQERAPDSPNVAWPRVVPRYTASTRAAGLRGSLMQQWKHKQSGTEPLLESLISFAAHPHGRDATLLCSPSVSESEYTRDPVLSMRSFSVVKGVRSSGLPLRFSDGTYAEPGEGVLPHLTRILFSSNCRSPGQNV